MGFRGDEILRAVFFAHGEAGYIRPGSGERIDDVALTEDVAEVQSIARSQIVVEAETELVVVGGFALCGDEGVGANVGERIESENVLRDGIDERHLVERQRLRRRRENVEDLAVGTGAVGIDAAAITIEVSGSRS